MRVAEGTTTEPNWENVPDWLRPQFSGGGSYFIDSGEDECDKYKELDWECTCDGPGVEPDSVPSWCADTDGDGDADYQGGESGSAPPGVWCEWPDSDDCTEVLTGPDPDSEDRTLDEDTVQQGPNHYGCKAWLGIIQDGQGNVGAHARVFCDVVVASLTAEVVKLYRRQISGGGEFYWHDLNAGRLVTMPGVSEVNAYAMVRCENMSTGVGYMYRAIMDAKGTTPTGKAMFLDVRFERMRTEPCLQR